MNQIKLKDIPFQGRRIEITTSKIKVLLEERYQIAFDSNLENMWTKLWNNCIRTVYHWSLIHEEFKNSLSISPVIRAILDNEAKQLMIGLGEKLPDRFQFVPDEK